MRRLFPVLLLVVAGCGVDSVDLDPTFISSLRFDCDPSTVEPACPPFTCPVNTTGTVDVTGCSQACDTDPAATAHTLTFDFKGPTGTQLCVPPQCEVKAQNTAPVCEAGCSENGQTTFLFDYSCTGS